jgi:hypothetical protein
MVGGIKMSFTHKAVLDDITLVTALLCDDRVKIDDCTAENHPQKKAVAAHCSWTLDVSMTEEEWDALVHYVKSREKEQVFSYYCPKCGVAWLENGACGLECAAEGPSFYLFDNSKGAVVASLRTARQDLANERGEGTLYARNK